MKKITLILKKSLLSLTASAFILAPVSMAQAEYKQDRQYKERHYNNKSHNDRYRERHNDRRSERRSERRKERRHERAHRKEHYSYNNHRKNHYRDHRKNHYRNHYRNHNRHYSYNHRNRYRHYNHRPTYHSHRSNHGSDLAFGLVAGSLLTYGLTQSARNDDYYGNRTVYVQQQPVKYAQPNQQTWTQSQAPAQPDNNCLQVREYQTTITIGGRDVRAYGQSCLQPDGSWKLGTPIPEPDFQ